MDATRFAIVDGTGLVLDVIVAADQSTAESVTGSVAVPDPIVVAGIGDTWDGTKFVKAQPAVPMPPTNVQVL